MKAEIFQQLTRINDRQVRTKKIPNFKYLHYREINLEKKLTFESLI